MSVHQLPDGRWQVQHARGKDPARPGATKKYFGRGPDAEQEAKAFNESLGLGVRTLQRSPTFVELANEYLAAKRHTVTASTLDDLRIRLPGVILPILGDLQTHEITAGRLDRYVNERSKKVKLTTIRRELTMVRAILRWSVRRKLIASYPAEFFSFPRADDARLQPPTQDEFDAILECSSPHLRRAMLISYHTGLRPGKELLSLTWDAVDFAGKTLMVLSAEKGGIPTRMIPLNSTILAHLGRWYADDQNAGIRYLVHFRGRPIDSFDRAWKMAKKRAGVTRRIRPYELRHRFTSDLLEAGADLKSVSELLGHKSTLMTTKVYQRTTSAMKRKAVDFLK